MYCEIIVEHRKEITAAGLQFAIGNGRLGKDIPVAIAYGMSAIYGAAPPKYSLFAFDTVRSCFVIVRQVNFRISIYHLEGTRPALSVETLFRAAQEYSENLIAALPKPPGDSRYKCRSLAVQIFEDNAREAGVEGKLVTLASAFREKLAWNELRSSVIAFLTAFLLIWLRLKQESPKAALASLIIALAITLSEIVVSYYRGRGSIKWKLRQG